MNFVVIFKINIICKGNLVGLHASARVFQIKENGHVNESITKEGKACAYNACDAGVLSTDSLIIIIYMTLIVVVVHALFSHVVLQ